MKLVNLLPVMLLLMAGCKPKPIDIDIPQQQSKITVFTSCLNDSTIVVSAGYSITSLQVAEDNTDNWQRMKDLLVDDAIVTMTGTGQVPDTLEKVVSGIFRLRNKYLNAGGQYQLMVADKKKNIIATAATTYMPKPDIESIAPEIIRNTSDTIIKLRLRVKNVGGGSWILISYNSGMQAKEQAKVKLNSFLSFSPKRIEFIEGNNEGIAEGVFTLPVSAKDTLAVHIGRIDDAYYRYLSAYKRTGYLINQMTGEPINLPTNIRDGLGYFALYTPEKHVFDLNKY